MAYIKEDTVVSLKKPEEAILADTRKKSTARPAAVKSAVKAAAKATAPAPAAQPARQEAIDRYVATGYVPAAAVTGAYDRYHQQLEARPDAYQSAYDQLIAEAFSQIMDRGKFEYDLNGDTLYQQMKDRYLQQGNLAMRDTLGQAAALTGGYGNSYGLTAGQQAYGQQIQGLSDNAPALRDRAYRQWADEGSQMHKQVGLMQELEADDYGQYRDQVTDWQKMLGLSRDVYADERDADYERYSDKRAYDLELEQYNDQKRQDAQALQLALAKAAGGGSSGGGSKAPGFSKAELARLEELLEEEEKKKMAGEVPRWAVDPKTAFTGR